jgi:hypothetical protein
MLFQDRLTKRVDLAKRDDLHPGALEPEGKPADPAKEIEDAHVIAAAACAVW